jgi:dTDP-4-amino-4,6-dideoxygalactose transaminase
MGSDRPAILGGAGSVRAGEHRLWPNIQDADRRAVLRVLDRGVFSGSHAPEAQALEERFAEYVGAKYCLLTHCGTSALQLALAAAGVGRGAEVIVPAYSFIATPLAVVLQGATPVFVDVDPLTGHLDLARTDAAVTPLTRAIMPVHIHGQASDMPGILALAERSGLSVVEDAAQAHGATVGGKPVGALGSAGGFSLQSSKNLAAGEGGLFVTNDREGAEIANRVRNFGQDLNLSDATSFDSTHPLDGTRSLQSVMLGSMYRGNEMMAALARSQLERLPERTQRCAENAESLSARLRELPGVIPPAALPGRSSVHHKYRVHLDPERAGLSCSPVMLRESIKAALEAEGCEVVYWQSQPLPAQDVFRQRLVPALQVRAGGTDLTQNYDPARYPNTTRLLDGSLLLFSQSYPLIGQDARLVDRYAEAFARVWHHREEIVSRAAR